ncbi:hypothetical protein Tco_1065904 [Tanacetum coccineum]
MIKEHDHQAKAKATPKRLAYDESKEGDSSGLGTKGLSERPSHVSSSMTGAHGKVHSSRKSQRSLSCKKASSLPRSSRIKGVPPVMRISAFMYGHGHPELAKKLNDKIPKTVDDMFERVRAFIKGEVSDRIRGRNGPKEFRRNIGTCTPYSRRDTFTPLTKTPKEILAIKSVSFPPPPPLVGSLEKQNLNKFCDYHGDKGHNTNDCYHLKRQIEEVVASGKLAHLVKYIRRGNQQNGG